MARITLGKDVKIDDWIRQQQAKGLIPPNQVISVNTVFLEQNKPEPAVESPPTKKKKKSKPIVNKPTCKTSIMLRIDGLRLVSEANTSDHWAVKYRRVKKVKETVESFLPKIELRLPVRVTLTRYSRKLLDKHDNLSHSFKQVVDSIADWIGYADNNPGYEWIYLQSAGKRKGCDILIEEV